MTRHEALAELGLTDPCTPEQIKAAFRKRSKITHPDSGGSEGAFKRTTEAYATLTSGTASNTGPQANRQQATGAPIDTREKWLQTAHMRIGIHAAAGTLNVPFIRLSVGYGRGGRRKEWSVIPGKDTADNTPQGFVSPEINTATLAIDAIASTVIEQMNREKDQKTAKAFKRLWPYMKPSVEKELPPYPQPKVTGNTSKTEGTRLLKAICPACGYVVRVTKKWADIAMPHCGQCDEEFKLA